MADPNAINIPTLVVSALTSGAVGGLVSFLVKRFADKEDAREDRRVAAFDAVLDAMAKLNFTGKDLIRRHERSLKLDFTSTGDAVRTLHEVIETKRFATGSVFSTEAAKVCAYWDDVMQVLWDEGHGAQFEADTMRPEKHIYDAIPADLRKRIAPGTLADLEAAALAKKKLEEESGGLVVVVPPGTPPPVLNQPFATGPVLPSSEDQIGAPTLSLNAGTPVEKISKD